MPLTQIYDPAGSCCLQVHICMFVNQSSGICSITSCVPVSGLTQLRDSVLKNKPTSSRGNFKVCSFKIRCCNVPPGLSSAVMAPDDGSVSRVETKADEVSVSWLSLKGP